MSETAKPDIFEQRKQLAESGEYWMPVLSTDVQVLIADWKTKEQHLHAAINDFVVDSGLKVAFEKFAENQQALASVSQPFTDALRPLVSNLASELETVAFAAQPYIEGFQGLIELQNRAEVLKSAGWLHSCVRLYRGQSRFLAGFGL